MQIVCKRTDLHTNSTLIARTKPSMLTRLACIIHEDSAPRVNSAKQVILSPEKRGPPRAEGDRVRCDALLALASNRQSAILELNINSLLTL